MTDAVEPATHDRSTWTRQRLDAVSAAQEVTDMRTAVDALANAIADWQAGLPRDHHARHIPPRERRTSRRDGACRRRCDVCRTTTVQEQLAAIDDNATEAVLIGLHAADIPTPATPEIQACVDRIRGLLHRHGHTTAGRWRPAKPPWQPAK